MPKPKKKPYNGRDHLIVKVISGVTKAGIHKDQKKEANKMAARLKDFWEERMAEDWADTNDAKIKCLMCGFPYDQGSGKDSNEAAAMECGYCSVSCMDYHPTED